MYLKRVIHPSIKKKKKKKKKKGKKRGEKKGKIKGKKIPIPRHSSA